MALYLSNFISGNSDPESIARALVYPRVLGTSISTSFGTNIQHFCSHVLPGYASLIPGLDIEFVDQLDERRKYCQIKAGPNTINKDDIKTIIDHFSSVKHLARTNQQKGLHPNDLIVGVLYGTREELSQHYRNIDKQHPVHAGREFWHRLTGDHDFYFDLIATIAEIAQEVDGSDLLEEVIQKLANEIRKKGI